MKRCVGEHCGAECCPGGCRKRLKRKKSKITRCKPGAAQSSLCARFEKLSMVKRDTIVCQKCVDKRNGLTIAVAACDWPRNDFDPSLLRNSRETLSAPEARSNHHKRASLHQLSPFDQFLIAEIAPLTCATAVCACADFVIFDESSVRRTHAAECRKSSSIFPIGSSTLLRPIPRVWRSSAPLAARKSAARRKAKARRSRAAKCRSWQRRRRQARTNCSAKSRAASAR